MMTDWEQLLDQLDDYVDENDTMELKIQDPLDMEDAKKRYNRFKLKCIVKVLEQYLKPSNQVSLRKLSRRVFMSDEAFRKHLVQYRFLKSCETKKWTYSGAIMKLKNDELAEIRVKCVTELRKLSESRAIRKRTLNHHW